MQKKTSTYSTVSLLHLVHICLRDYVHTWGGAERGVLWQHEVNQHSLHIALHHKLSQSAEDYGLAQTDNKRETSPESAVTKNPAVCSYKQ